MACIEEDETNGPPSELLDCSTLSVTLDNQGVATISFTVLRLSKLAITNPRYVTAIGVNRFRGFIESDIQERLQGTNYYSHQITARGAIC